MKYLRVGGLLGLGLAGLVGAVVVREIIHIERAAWWPDD